MTRNYKKDPNTFNPTHDLRDLYWLSYCRIYFNLTLQSSLVT